MIITRLSFSDSLERPVESQSTIVQVGIKLLELLQMISK